MVRRRWAIKRRVMDDPKFTLFFGKKYPKSGDLDRVDGWHLYHRYATKFATKAEAESFALTLAVKDPSLIGMLVVRSV